MRDTRVFSPFVDACELRAQFPVLGRVAYLNAGTDGPLPARAVRAAGEELEREARDGRALSHFQRRFELADELRSAYAGLLGCETSDVALTTCTSEGIAQTISGLALGPGDEIVTGDEEHPGLLGALSAERQLRALLDLLGLGDAARKPVASLPFAVQKRVELARALIGAPKLLLLDEPAGGLGAEDVDELAGLIRALPNRDRGGCAVALVEHHMDLVMRVCERVVVLDFGRVIAAGAPDEVRNDPVVADAYLGTDADPEAFGSNRAGAAAPDRGDAPGRGVEERRRPEAPRERADGEAR